MVEYSALCNSPNLRKTNNLYYGGPKSYYIFNKTNLLNHTVTSDTITIEKINEQQHSFKMDNNLALNKNFAIVDYIKGKSSYYPVPMAVTKRVNVKNTDFLQI